MTYRIPALAAALMLPICGAGAQTLPEGSTLIIGGGAAVGSAYSGSDDTRVSPLVYFDYHSASGFFVNPGRGIGYEQAIGNVSVSGALGYGMGRKEKNESFGQGSDALRGMGDISAGAVANFGIKAKLPADFTVGANASVAVGKRDRGDTLELFAAKRLLTAASDQLELSLSSQYGDSQHAQTWYGVTTAQSARTGYRAYSAGAGFEEVKANLAWTHVLNQNWSVRSSLGVVHLLGDAADSPIVFKKTAPVAGVTVNYRY